MKCYDFDWQINEFMVYCRSTQLRDRTMYSKGQKEQIQKSAPFLFKTSILTN